MTSWSHFGVIRVILGVIVGVMFGVIFGVVGISFDTHCRMQSLRIGHCNRGTLALNVHAMHWLSRGRATVLRHGRSRACAETPEACWRRCPQCLLGAAPQSARARMPWL